MVLLSVAAATLLSLPFASAEVHRIKLNKVPPVLGNPELETLHLAEKYGAAQPQSPLVGAGGSGRRLRKGGNDLFWTQEEPNGGHNVPLSSTFPPVSPRRPILNVVRLFECAVFRFHYSGNAAPGGQSYMNEGSLCIAHFSQLLVQGHP